MGHSNVHWRNANGLSIPSRRKVLVSYDVFREDALSVGKLTQSGAEVKVGDKNSWIDLQTDAGVQRVPVRVKGETFGLSIQKTDAWIIPETSGPALHAVVAPVDEEIGRAEQPNRAPAAQEAAAVPGPEETQGVRLEREATDFAANCGRVRHSWDNHSAMEDSSDSNVQDMRNC